MRPVTTMLVVCCLATPADAAPGPSCQPRPVPQETYALLRPLVFAYVPNIDKAAGGWKAFAVRILQGQYRNPFLLDKGFMRERDVVSLLAQRRDVKEFKLPVAEYRPKQMPPPRFEGLVTIESTDGTSNVAVSIQNVVLAQSVSFGSDQVVLNVCVTETRPRSRT
jgi:hypothetical protein